MRSRPTSIRRGALAVEGAIVYSAFFVLLLGLIVGGLGVFRYEQVACQAREASRWAAVRGSQWAADSKQPSPSSNQVLQQAVYPLASGMSPASLSIQMWWVDQSTGLVYPWDTASKAPTSLAGSATVTNTVRVTVTYQWMPEILLAGPINLRSTSEIPMSY